MNKKPFKILSIDGGGLKGIYSLQVLKVIEDTYCKPKGTVLSDHFDLICGTSTGGIIALGIANKMKIDDILKIYDDNAIKIFPKPYKFNNPYCVIGTGMLGFVSTFLKTKNIYLSSFVGLSSCFLPYVFDRGSSILRPTLGYRYDTKTIADIADKHFGTMKMNDLNNLVCIPSYEIGTGANRIFKFPHKEGGLERDKNVTVKDAILSTTCAPTYFPVHKILSGGLANGYFVDGGIWANNPSMVGIIEALQYFVGPTKEYSHYEILSIGNINCNNNEIPKTDTERKYFWNATNFSSLINIIFDSNAKSTHHFARVLTDFSGGFHKRIESNDLSHKFSHLCELDNSDENVLEQYKLHGNKDGYNAICPQNEKYKDLERFFVSRKSYDVTK